MSEHLRNIYSGLPLPTLEQEADKTLERIWELQARYELICNVLSERTADVVIIQS